MLPHLRHRRRDVTDSWALLLLLLLFLFCPAEGRARDRTTELREGCGLWPRLLAEEAGPLQGARPRGDARHARHAVHGRVKIVRSVVVS